MSDESSDAAIEAEVQAKGLNAPRITKESIDALVERVMMAGGQIPDTTTTILHAFLDGQFYLGTEYSACVSPENFDEELGFKIAREKLTRAVRTKFWELEGYRLYREQNPDPA